MIVGPLPPDFRMTVRWQAMILLWLYKAAINLRLIRSDVPAMRSFVRWLIARGWMGWEMRTKEGWKWPV